MIARLFARLSDSPVYKPGMRAYDVHYRTPEGDTSTTFVLTGRTAIGESIRQTLFAEHPEATDYTMQEVDYMSVQLRVIVDKALGMTMGRMSKEDYIGAKEQF